MITLKYNTEKTHRGVKKENYQQFRQFSKKYKKKYIQKGGQFEKEKADIEKLPTKSLTKTGLIIDILTENGFSLKRKDLPLTIQNFIEGENQVLKELLVNQIVEEKDIIQFISFCLLGTQFNFTENDSKSKNELVSDTIKFLEKSQIYKKGLPLKTGEPDSNVNVTIDYKEYTYKGINFKIITGLTLNKNYNKLYNEALTEILEKINNKQHGTTPYDSLEKMPHTVKMYDFIKITATPIGQTEPEKKVVEKNLVTLINFYISDQELIKNILIRHLTNVTMDNPKDQDYQKSKESLIYLIRNGNLPPDELPKTDKKGPTQPLPKNIPASYVQRVAIPKTAALAGKKIAPAKASFIARNKRPPLTRRPMVRGQTYPQTNPKNPRLQGRRPQQKKQPIIPQKTQQPLQPKQGPPQQQQAVRTTGPQYPQPSYTSTIGALGLLGSSPSQYRDGSRSSKSDNSGATAALAKATKDAADLKRQMEREERARKAKEKEEKEKGKPTTDPNDPLNKLFPGAQERESKHIEQFQEKSSEKNFNLVKTYDEIKILFKWNDIVSKERNMLAFFVSDNVTLQLKPFLGETIDIKIKADSENIFNRSIGYYADINSPDFLQKVYEDEMKKISTSDKLIHNEPTLALKIHKNMNNDFNKCKRKLDIFINPFAYSGIISQAIDYVLTQFEPSVKKIKAKKDDSYTPKDQIPELRERLNILSQSISDETNTHTYIIPDLPKPILKVSPSDAEPIEKNSWGAFKKEVQDLMRKISITEIDDNLKWKPELSKYIEDKLKSDFEKLNKIFDDYKNITLFDNSTDFYNALKDFITTTYNDKIFKNITKDNIKTIMITQPNNDNVNINFEDIYTNKDISRLTDLETALNTFVTYVNGFYNFYSNQDKFKGLKSDKLTIELNTYNDIILSFVYLVKFLNYNFCLTVDQKQNPASNPAAIIDKMIIKINEFDNTKLKPSKIAAEKESKKQYLTQEDQKFVDMYKKTDQVESTNFEENYTQPFKNLKLFYDVIIKFEGNFKKIDEFIPKIKTISTPSEFSKIKSVFQLKPNIIPPFNNNIESLEKLKSLFKQTETSLNELALLTGQDVAKAQSDTIRLEIKAYQEKVTDLAAKYKSESERYSDQSQRDSMFNNIHTKLIAETKEQRAQIEKLIKDVNALLSKKPDDTVKAIITGLEKEFNDISKELPPLFNINENIVKIDNLYKLITEVLEKATALKAELDKQKSLPSTNTTPHKLLKLFLEKNEVQIKELKTKKEEIDKSLTKDDTSYIETDPNNTTDPDIKRKLLEYNIKSLVDKLNGIMKEFNTPDKSIDDLIEEGNKLINNIYILIDIIGKSLLDTHKTQKGGTGTGAVASVNFFGQPQQGIAQSNSTTTTSAPTTSTTTTSAPTSTTTTTTTTSGLAAAPATAPASTADPASAAAAPASTAVPASAAAAPASTAVPATASTTVADAAAAAAISTVTANKQVPLKEAIEKLLLELESKKDNIDHNPVKKSQESIIHNLFEAERLLEGINESIKKITLDPVINIDSISKKSTFTSLYNATKDIIKKIKEYGDITAENDPFESNKAILNNINSIIKAIDEQLTPNEPTAPALRSILKQLSDDMTQHTKYKDVWELLRSIQQNDFKINKTDIQNDADGKKMENILKLLNELHKSILDSSITDPSQPTPATIKVSDLYDKLPKFFTPDNERLFSKYREIKEIYDVNKLKYDDIKGKIDLLNEFKDKPITEKEDTYNRLQKLPAVAYDDSLKPSNLLVPSKLPTSSYNSGAAAAPGLPPAAAAPELYENMKPAAPLGATITDTKGGVAGKTWTDTEGYSKMPQVPAAPAAPAAPAENEYPVYEVPEYE